MRREGALAQFGFDLISLIAVQVGFETPGRRLVIPKPVWGSEPLPNRHFAQRKLELCIRQLRFAQCPNLLWSDRNWFREATT